MIKILVIGPGSLTGSRFLELGEKSFKLYGAGISMDTSAQNLVDFWEMDITSQEKVKEVISAYPGKYVINFAGATLVDEIEKTRPKNPNDEVELEKNSAYKINVLGTKYLAKVCMEYGKFPIFISTGFVFDGKAGPYFEDGEMASSPEDVSWYGWTKVLAEKEVEKSGVKNITLRISYPYRSEYSGKLDFARNLLKIYDDFKSGIREDMYPMFSDQTLTPTLIDDIPGAVIFLLEREITGLIHLTSPEVTTPYDFCLEILRVARNVEDPGGLIRKGSIVDFQSSHPGIAKRPFHGGEKSDKIIKAGFTPTGWREGIRKAYGK